MPLTNKGQKIMKSMRKKYGGKEGESVFYASKNKGTIKGVEEAKKKDWIQGAEEDIEKRGTEGVCTGDKFGGPTCPPGSKRYNLAKTFKKMAKKRQDEGAVKPGAGKLAKKLGDENDDKWEDEETKKGYWTPSADDTTGYSSQSSDNADDDFKHGGWTKETKAKTYKKMKKLKNEDVKGSASKEMKKVSAIGADAKERARIASLMKANKERKDEAQSFSKTQMDTQKDALKPLNPKPKKAKTPSLTTGGNTTAGANAAGDEGVPVGNDANKKAQELKQQNIKTRSMYEKEDTIMNRKRIDEVLPAIAAGLARAGAVVGRGAAKAGGAVAKTAGKAAGKAAGQAGKYLTKKAGEHAKGAAKTAVKRTLATAKEKLSSEDKPMEDNTQYKNSYVRSLMEMDGPTTKELDDIKKEKPAKIPKKKYFGGETDIKKVDTRAAIASHKKGIRAAGEATKPKPEVTPEPQRSPSGQKRSKKSQAADKRAGVLVSHTEYHRIGKIIAETEFPKGPTAKRYGALGRAKEGASKIKDPLVKREVAKTKANVDKKTKSKTNPKVSDLVQGSMNRRRGESRRKGTGGLPPLDKQTSTADAKRDRYRRMAPGDK